jgi:hypothetical protein
MGLNLSIRSGDELPLAGDLDTRGKPTEKASRINAHSELHGQALGSGVAGAGFATLLAGKAGRRPVLASAGVPLRATESGEELAPATVELIGKRRAAEDRPRDPRFPQPFEVERTVGAATPQRDRDGQKRRPMPFPKSQPDEKEGRKRFMLGPRPQAVAAAPAAPAEGPLSEWERALLLEDELNPGTVPLVGRARRGEEPIEPVLISGRGRQRGPLPMVRRPKLPAPRIPATKVVATVKTLGPRAFAKNVVEGGKKDPRKEGRVRIATGGHAGRR